MNRFKIDQYLSNDVFDLICCLILAIILFTITAPWFHLPFYWDTGGFLIPAAKSIAETGNLTTYFNLSDYPHFFLLPWLISLIYKVPGNHIVLIHVFSYILSAFFLTTMYFLGKFANSRLFGFILALSFITNPLFIAQTNLVYFEIVGTALLYLSIIFLIKKHYYLFIVTGLLAQILVSNTIVLFFLSILYLYKNGEITNKLSWFIKFSLPLLIVTMAWLSIHYYFSGWFLYSPYRSYTEDHLYALQQSLFYITVSQGRIFFSIFALFSIIVLIYKNSVNKVSFLLNNNQSLIIFLLIAAASAILRITTLGYLLNRHVFTALPFFYLITSLLIFSAFKNRLVLISIIFISLLSVQTMAKYDCQTNSLEDCYAMFTLLEQKKRAANALEFVGQNSLIAASFSEDGELSNPFLGFVTHPLSVVNTEDLKTQAPDFVYITTTSSPLLSEYINKHNYKIYQSYPIKNTNAELYIYSK